MSNLPFGKSTKKSDNLRSVKYNSNTCIVANKIDINDSKLGPYYLDLTQSIVDYREFTYGEFDENGVPMIGWGNQAMYNPVNIAQFGFIVHDLWLQNQNKEYLLRLKNILKWFELNKETYKDSIVWPSKIDDNKYKLKAGFISAMTIGEVLSFYLRMYQILNDKSLLETSYKIYNFFQYTYQEGGAKRYDENGYVWFEEFPTNTPSYVLNGFIYAVYGILDLYRVTKDKNVKQVYDSCISTLVANIHKYDCSYWSIYDQLKKELVMVYYQKNVHVPQVDSLYILTKNPVFKHYRDKWENNINPLNILFVKLMYRIRPRILKLLKLVR